MEQIAVNFTDGWVPKTWLTPLATIIDLNGNVMVENGVCKELGYWWYIYRFDRYSPEKVYLYVFDWWDTLESDYDRYKFWGNELDAYSNKYSWGRAAAPYFTQLTDWINWKFTKSEKLIKDISKKIKNYDDKDLRWDLSDLKRTTRDKYLDLIDRINEVWKSLEEVSKSVVDTSATNDWNSSKNFSGINGKLDLLAQFLTQFKWDIDEELNTIDDNVAQRIIESNTSINETMSNRVTIEQLLQQVERLETQLNKILDTVVNDKLPKEIRDEYDVNITRKNNDMSDEEMMAVLGIPTNDWNQYWLNQWLNEWVEMWMEEGLSEWLNEWMWEARPEQLNAPVDMQWIAEPEMPMWAL